MTGASERLDAIEARLAKAAPGAITITPSDVSGLLDLARKQRAALDAVEKALYKFDNATQGYETIDQCADYADEAIERIREALEGK